MKISVVLLLALFVYSQANPAPHNQLIKKLLAMQTPSKETTVNLPHISSLKTSFKRDPTHQSRVLDLEQYGQELLNAVELYLLEPYEEYLPVPILDIPKQSVLEFITGLLHVITSVHTHCSEDILTSFLSGAVIVQFEDDEQLEAEIVNDAFERIPNLDDLVDRETLLTDIRAARIEAFEPAVDAIKSLTEDDGVPSAAELWRSLKQDFTAENLLQWTLADVVEVTLATVIDWQKNNIAPLCHSSDTSGVFQSLKMLASEAQEKLDRCLVKEVFVEVFSDHGVSLEDEVHLTLNQLIAEYVETKDHILLDVQYGFPDLGYYFYNIFEFLENYLEEPIKEAFVMKQVGLIAGLQDENLLDAVVRYVMSGDDDPGYMYQHLLTSILRDLFTSGKLSEDDLRNSIGKTLENLCDECGEIKN